MVVLQSRNYLSMPPYKQQTSADSCNLTRCRFKPSTSPGGFRVRVRVSGKYGRGAWRRVLWMAAHAWELFLSMGLDDCTVIFGFKGLGFMAWVLGFGGFRVRGLGGLGCSMVQ